MSVAGIFVVGMAILLVVTSGASNAVAASRAPDPTVEPSLAAPARSNSPLVAGPPLSAVCPSAGCPRSSAEVLDSPRLASLGSTAANWLVANWSGEGMIAENPQHPGNLVAGGLFQEPSSYNDTTTYYYSGVSGAFTSWDGGRHWTDQTLPPDPQWFNVSSATCDQLHLADTAVAFGPNNTVYYVDLSDTIGNVVGCHASGGLGVYVTISTDGGDTWGTPIPIHGTQTGASMDKPWIAVDPTTGELYVAYNDDSNGTISLQNSTDGGLNWSQPVVLASTAEGGLGVELAVDPSGGVDASWMDTGTANIEFVRSTDHGATFSSPSRVATAINAYPSSSPDSFRDYTLPAIGVEDFPGLSNTGYLYVTWQNGSGATTGSPAVYLSHSADNGTHWSSPVRVNSDLKPQDYQPSIAAGPDGTVYVDWYAVNSGSGHYRLAAALSHDGGRTFDRQLNVSDADSFPHTAATGYDWWIGDYTHTIADSLGARPLWTDARSPQGWACANSQCLWGYVYNISFYTALIVNDSLSATVPVNVTLNGTIPWPGTLALSPETTPADWLAGDTYNLTAPSSVPVGGTTYFFGYWYGHDATHALLFSNSSALNGTVAGGERLVACYVATGSYCHSPGAPGFLQISAQPANAEVRLNGVLLPSPLPSGLLPETPGTYWVNASAPQFYTLNQSFTVTPGNVTRASVSLVRISGDLVGRVSPSNAAVRLNGSVVAVAANGSFSMTLAPGTYSMSATAPEYYPYTNSSVSIRSATQTDLAIVLVGYPGWINGTVSPASASLQLNGQAAPVAPDGTFALQAPPGTYWLNGSKAGWATNSSGAIVLAPGGTARVALVLSQYVGSVAGFIYPENASVQINGTAVPVAGGSFSASLPPGTYWMNASAWGYDPLARQFDVHANVTDAMNLVMNLSAGWIRGTVTPAAALLTVDGRTVTISPDGSFNLTLAPGSHTVTAQAGGYRPWNETVSVHPGRATAVAVDLSPTSAGSTVAAVLPYILLGIGLIVAVGGVILWRRRKRRAGT